jgi:hypothetical protein
MAQILLETQKDSLFKIILNHEFNPKDFDVEYTRDGYPVVNYKYDNYYAAFVISEDVFSRYLYISPGKELAKESIDDLPNWEAYERGFSKWLVYLKRELNAGFYWDNISESQVKLKEGIEDLDQPMSEIELELIQVKFENIKKDLTKLQLSEDQLKSIETKLDHLEGMAKKLSRKDWLNLIIGTLGTHLISLSLPPETISEIWQVVRVHFEMWLVLPW